MTLTPKQFNLLATKDDIGGLEERLERKFSEKMDKILTAVDKIAKDYKDHETEHAANIGAHDRFERRITKLEKTVRAGI